MSFSDISRYDVALPARGLQAREVFEQLVARYRLRLNVRAELNEVNILLKLIRQSRLVTILSESAISGPPPSGNLPQALRLRVHPFAQRVECRSPPCA